MKKKQYHYLKPQSKNARWLLILLPILILIMSSLVYAFGRNNILDTDEKTSCAIPTINKSDRVSTIFEWRDVTQLSASEMADSIVLAKNIGINTINLNVDRYIEISELKDVTQKNIKANEFNNSVSEYLRIANQNNIKVNALAGGTQWSTKDHWYLNELIIKSVYEFNIVHLDKFKGIEFDVEPYATKEFKNNPSETLTEFIDYVAKAYDSTDATFKDVAMPLGFSVPFWLDENGDGIKQIKINGVSLYPIQHLIEIVNSHKGTLTIMAYRNALDGKDGIYSHISDEFDYAETKNTNKVLIIGQEIGDVKPDKTTYFSVGYDQAITNINEILAQYGEKKYFAGVAFNDMKSLKSLYSNRKCVEKELITSKDNSL